MPRGRYIVGLGGVRGARAARYTLRLPTPREEVDDAWRVTGDTGSTSRNAG